MINILEAEAGEEMCIGALNIIITRLGRHTPARDAPRHLANSNYIPEPAGSDCTIEVPCQTFLY